MAGGAGMLLVNTDNIGEELLADPHILPATSLGARAAGAIKKYASAVKTPTASITFGGTVYGNPAPVMASFSSRGPGSVGPDVIKPDVTAPGLGDLNYPSFAVLLNGTAPDAALTYKRTVKNVGTPRSTYVVQVMEPKGVAMTVEPRVLDFQKVGETLPYKVKFVALAKTSSATSSFGSLAWVSGKFSVRSPIAGFS
ncbi:hypothetical protein RJ639_033154 [Escallonia herrerae]|uniref:Subtilisin-like protease fibronectin type-III domain-containing protein n=1 Tax=Escallonia herrerae TaxID=1293975 RepID=A0AA89BL24_9ASTE|nr:hypothetical protein RJ639_033154 [Escallonia herrerae]